VHRVNFDDVRTVMNDELRLIIKEYLFISRRCKKVGKYFCLCIRKIVSPGLYILQVTLLFVCCLIFQSALCFLIHEIADFGGHSCGRNVVDKLVKCRKYSHKYERESVV
jgi:hypothetical protein